MKSYKRLSSIGKRIIVIAIVLLCGLLISGCAVNNDKVILSNINNGLNSCIGKLTKDKLIMIASTPTDKTTLDNGEIWVYKYKKSKTKTTYHHYGGLFDDESESENEEYPYEVRLRFDKNGILVDYVSSGYFNVVNHPFKTLTCEGFQSPVPNSGNTPVPTNATGGYFGVKFQTMTQDLAEASGLDKVKGAFVIIAQKNSPAEQAGIKSGDIILAFDGKNINEASALPPIVATTPIGKTVDVVIFRNGKEQTVKVKIGNIQSAMPNSGNASVPTIPTGVYQATRSLGNGDKYVGDFVKGKFNGKGTYTYANGDKYEGEFVDGKFTGKGTFTCSNGKQFTGNLENKEPLELTIRCN